MKGFEEAESQMTGWNALLVISETEKKEYLELQKQINANFDDEDYIMPWEEAKNIIVYEIYKPLKAQI